MPANEIVTMNADAWEAEGTRLFGPEQLNWKFKCPICGNVQSPADFLPYKNEGATPDSAYKVCIGRFLPDGKQRRAFGFGGATALPEPKAPCDYTSGGLFNLNPLIVEAGEHKISAFAFADA